VQRLKRKKFPSEYRKSLPYFLVSPYVGGNKKRLAFRAGNDKKGGKGLARSPIGQGGFLGEIHLRENLRAEIHKERERHRLRSKTEIGPNRRTPCRTRGFTPVQGGREKDFIVTSENRVGRITDICHNGNFRLKRSKANVEKKWHSSVLRHRVAALSM